MKSKTKKKTYLVFLYPSFFISDTKEIEVKERNPEKVKMPIGAYCFYYFDEDGKNDMKQ